MTKKEKLMKGLKCCSNIEGSCIECPYRHDMKTSALCMGVMAADILELLKEEEQSEADEVAPTIGEGAEGEEVICCGSCGTSLYHLFPWVKINKAREFVRYCRHCGQKVKWDD